MVRGLLAAGFKKQREYVKHLIDLLAPLRPETMDKEYTIKKLVHINSHITWVDGGRESWRKERARTRDLEGIRALNKKQAFLKSTLHRFYGSLPDESTLEVSQCIMVGGRLIFRWSIVPEENFK